MNDYLKDLLESKEYACHVQEWHNFIANQLMDMSDEELVDITKKCLMFCSFRLCGMHPTADTLASEEVVKHAFRVVLKSLKVGLT